MPSQAGLDDSGMLLKTSNTFTCGQAHPDIAGDLRRDSGPIHACRHIRRQLTELRATGLVIPYFLSTLSTLRHMRAYEPSVPETEIVTSKQGQLDIARMLHLSFLSVERLSEARRVRSM